MTSIAEDRASRSGRRVVALADSLALPRDEGGDRVRWEETWPRVLQRQLADCGMSDDEVINCATRARTATTLNGHDFQEHVRFKRPDVIVLQIGIVDCAPRIFSSREKRLLAAMPAAVRRSIVRWRAARRAAITARDPLRKVVTPPAVFASSLTHFASAVAALPWPLHIVVLPILSNRPVMEAKSPGHGSNVDRYNALLRDFCSDARAIWVAPEAVISGPGTAAAFCADGYHLTAAGQRRVAETLFAALCDDMTASAARTR